MFGLRVLGVKKRSLMFQGSAFVEGSKRTVIGLALAVAFFPVWSWVCKLQ